MLTREQMAMRVAQELRDGDYVNLGIGIPTLVANYIPAGIEVMLQSENGLLGMGEFPDEATIDADLITAGKQTVTAHTGAALFDSAQSFALIRGDVALVKGWKADWYGNVVYRHTAQNFNPLMATAGRITVVEVEEIVPPGELPPSAIHTPGIYVDRLIVGQFEKRIEQRTLRAGGH